jgi:hypothetical protein
MYVRIQLVTLEHCWSISTGSCFTTLLTDLILLWVTTTSLPTRRTSCDHSSSTVMRGWWKVSKCGWAHMWQTSLTQAYKDLFPDMTSASVPAVTSWRSSLRMCVFFVYNKCLFSLLVLLTTPEVTFQIALVCLTWLLTFDFLAVYFYTQFANEVMRKQNI